MARKCFISFKTEDTRYKLDIQNNLNIDIVDKSLNAPINSSDEDYIMRKIRENHLSDSTVTIFLIGRSSSENLGEYEQRFIKRELQASLYNGVKNTKNGILGIVVPSMKDSIYKGSGICSHCGNVHNYVHINDSTVIKEFSYNYYIPHDKCAWSEDDRYCVLVRWSDFIENPNQYIEKAFEKRASDIADKTKVKP